jgi:hypothetical protein
MHPAPFFAGLSRGDLSLLLSAPTGSGGAAQAMPDGRRQEPGGLHSPRGFNRRAMPRDARPATVGLQLEPMRPVAPTKLQQREWVVRVHLQAIAIWLI